MGTARIVATAGLVIGGATVAWAEWVTRRASRDALPTNDASTGAEPVLILVPGCPSGRGDRPGLMQRWRCRIAARSATSPHARFLFSGGPSRGGRSEAGVMADHAVRALGVDPRQVILEEASATTWENVRLSLPHLESAGTIVVASNTFHARRVRRYIEKQRPDLARRLRRGRDWIPGELALVKPALVALEWRRARRARSLGWS